MEIDNIETVPDLTEPRTTETPVIATPSVTDTNSVKQPTLAGEVEIENDTCQARKQQRRRPAHHKTREESSAQVQNKIKASEKRLLRLKHRVEYLRRFGSRKPAAKKKVWTVN